MHGLTLLFIIFSFISCCLGSNCSIGTISARCDSGVYYVDSSYNILQPLKVGYTQVVFSSYLNISNTVIITVGNTSHGSISAPNNCVLWNGRVVIDFQLPAQSNISVFVPVASFSCVTMTANYSVQLINPLTNCIPTYLLASTFKETTLYAQVKCGYPWMETTNITLRVVESHFPTTTELQKAKSAFAQYLNVSSSAVTIYAVNNTINVYLVKISVAGDFPANRVTAQARLKKLDNSVVASMNLFPGASEVTLDNVDVPQVISNVPMLLPTISLVLIALMLVL